MFGNLNPFNLSGPEFLWLYSVGLGVAIVVTLVWRILVWLTRSESGAPSGKGLDIWELAYLRGGDLAVAQTAVVELSTAKLVEADKNGSKLVATSQDPQVKLSPVAFAIYRAAQGAGGVSSSRLRREVAFECQRIRDQLIHRGFLKSWGDRIWEVWPGYAAFGVLTAAGLFRIGQGVLNGKPVLYLFTLVVVTVVFKMVLTLTRTNTPAGKRALNDSLAEVKKYQAKHTQTKSPNVSAEAADPAFASWAFAVMGLAAVQSTLAPDITELIKKRYLADSGSSSGCSGGGTGGCGGDGGSGCGGGGCGGGGCGGCGS
ncbi:MAG: TIGR04222 domain-containing membrane protein [Pirellulaceae bacterium]